MLREHWRRISLKIQLILVIVGITLVALLCVTGIFYRTARNYIPAMAYICSIWSYLAC